MTVEQDLLQKLSEHVFGMITAASVQVLTNNDGVSTHLLFIGTLRDPHMNVRPTTLAVELTPKLLDQLRDHLEL